MSAAVLEAPPSALASRRAERPFGSRRLTLEQRLERALRSAQREGAAECPVCHAAMHAEGASARCGGCGSVVA